MSRISLVVLGAALALGSLEKPANALPIVDSGDLNRHCVQKYRPRVIQALADPYGQPLYANLICRLTTGFGFTNERQTPHEVCQRLIGNPQASNANGRLKCGPSSTAGVPSFNPFGPKLTLSTPAPSRPGNGCNWVRVGTSHICI